MTKNVTFVVICGIDRTKHDDCDGKKSTKRLFLKLDSFFSILYHSGVVAFASDNTNSSINNTMKACICALYRELTGYKFKREPEKQLAAHFCVAFSV